ncbi:MAG: FAD-dependent oxidoreductase, partial [Spirochaetia bacterium]|nr:FAD-dependent oxidoreductase [Spirochaetia bacterium]
MKLRDSNIERLKNQTFEVLVVGGGINGGVSAAVLASRGVKTALIEKNDFAGFTSQETSNLVWGGIKYMETMEFGLVRDLCVSRNHLIRSYPSTIEEIRFFVNLEKGFRWPRLFLYMGSLLYWMIGNFFTRAPRLLSKKTIAKEEPVVSIDRSIGGFEYSDAYLHDNDARFAFGFVRRAIDNGAVAANYVESLGSRREGDFWITKTRDVMSGKEWEIKSRVLINACGPYVDEVNGRSSITTEHKHLFSKGIHLMLNRISPSNRVLTFFADDGRLFFIIPMGPKSCVGTTDTRVDTLPPHVTAEDRKFVLDNINHRLKLDRPFTEADIIAERCGVRPLVVNPKPGKKDTGDWMALSRRHAVDLNREKKHISIFGGKLTDCLNVGQEVSDLVKSLGIKMEYEDRVWYGEPPRSNRDTFYHQAKLMDLDAMTAPESSEPLSRRLWRRYGNGALAILEDIREDAAMGEVLIKGTEYLRGEIYHTARREMVT